MTELRNFGIVLILTVFAFCVNAQSLADEESSNYVEFKWYNINEDTWNDKGAGALMSGALSAQANTYCTATPAECSLNTWNTGMFGTGNIRSLSGYPREESPYWVFRVNIAFPGTANISGSPTSYVVPRAAVLQIITDARTQLNNYTGFHVVYIESVHYSPPVRKTLNAIMIPITLFIVLVITFLAVGLHYWRKNLDEEEERKERLASKSRDTGFGVNKNPGLVAESTPSLQRGRGRGASPYSQSGVGLSLDTPRSSRSHATVTAGSAPRLPPLEEAHHRKKQRKHKKKRTQESADSDDGRMNNGFQNERSRGEERGAGLPPPSNYERNRDTLRHRQHSDEEY